MVPSGLVGPLRWAVDLRMASVRIDGPFEMGDFERRQAELAKQAEEKLQRVLDSATPGSEHDDKELPYRTVVYVGRRRGEYHSFESKWVGANLHTIRFDDGSYETLKLKEVSDWRFVRK